MVILLDLIIFIGCVLLGEGILVVYEGVISSVVVVISGFFLIGMLLAGNEEGLFKDLANSFVAVGETPSTLSLVANVSLTLFAAIIAAQGGHAVVATFVGCYSLSVGYGGWRIIQEFKKLDQGN